MRNILFLVPDLEFRGTTQLVRTLASGLPRDVYRPVVCALGPRGPVAELLRSAGVHCEAFGWRGRFAANPYRLLRRRLREFQPDIVHTWDSTCLRLAWSASPRSGMKAPPRLVSSGALPEPRSDSAWSPLDRWLLRNVCDVVARGPADAE